MDRPLHLAVGTAALPAVSQIAVAQSYPSRPIHVIVGFPPGAAADVAGRVFAEGARTGFTFPIHAHMLRHACGYAFGRRGPRHATNSGLARS
jgi:hypothetical protein